MKPSQELYSECFGRLINVELKLYGIAHLVHGYKTNGVLPLDEDADNAHEGIGLILADLGEEVGDVWREMEAEQIRISRKSKSEE
jgi:hypothetical protein